MINIPDGIVIEACRKLLATAARVAEQRPADAAQEIALVASARWGRGGFSDDRLLGGWFHNWALFYSTSLMPAYLLPKLPTPTMRALVPASCRLIFHDNLTAARTEVILEDAPTT